LELKESLRQEHDVGRTLAEQLTDAISAEEYERAAKLRDEISRRSRKV
jgi:protein-arginine kinase activator protein McsA